MSHFRLGRNLPVPYERHGNRQRYNGQAQRLDMQSWRCQNVPGCLRTGVNMIGRIPVVDEARETVFSIYSTLGYSTVCK